MHKLYLYPYKLKKIIVFQLCCYAIYFPKKIKFFQEKGLTNSNRFIGLNPSNDYTISPSTIQEINYRFIKLCIIADRFPGLQIIIYRPHFRTALPYAREHAHKDSTFHYRIYKGTHHAVGIG